MLLGKSKENMYICRYVNIKLKTRVGIFVYYQNSSSLWNSSVSSKYDFILFERKSPYHITQPWLLIHAQNKSKYWIIIHLFTKKKEKVGDDYVDSYYWGQCSLILLKYHRRRRQVKEEKCFKMLGKLRHKEALRS